MKLGHIGLPVKNINASQKFYDAIASFVGLDKIDDHKDFVGYGALGLYQFYLHLDKEPVTGLHLCFEVGSMQQVDDFYHGGLLAGGIDNGKPGIREEYGADYYAAFLLDPDGNNIKALYRAD